MCTCRSWYSENNLTIFNTVLSSFIISVQSRNPICDLPKDAGLQQAAVGAVQRWFFNTQTEECEQFYFVQSGPGNANKFVTKEECEETCKEGEIHLRYIQVSVVGCV